MALGLVGALALLNMAIPVIQDPVLERVSGPLAVLYVGIGLVAFFFWRGFQQPSASGFWARLADTCKRHW